MWTLGYRTSVIWRDPDFIIGAEFAFGSSMSRRSSVHTIASVRSMSEAYW
jgi:hypothetical protein